MTQVSWVRQLALAAFLFVLATVAYWLEYKRKPAEESKQELSKKVFALRDATIQSIRISDGRRAFELGCLDVEKKLCKPGDNSSWEIREPARLKADDTNANSLVSAINNLNSTETIGLKEETPEKRAALLKEYGLDPASRQNPSTRKLTVQTTSGATTAYLGLTHPIGEGIFLLTEKDGKADEERVFLIPSYFKSNLDHDLTYWRDKKLLTLASHDVGSFVLESPKAGRIEGTLKDSAWTIRAKSEEFAGDIENIDGLLSGAAYLTAKSFPFDRKESPQARGALKGAKNSVTLTLKKKSEGKEAPAPVTVRLFEKSGKSGTLYATVSNLDPVFELESNAKERLDKSVKDLRLAKLITSMERFTAKKISFAGKPLGAKPIVLVSENGKWSAEDKSPVDAEKVQATLEKLSGNRIKDFISPVPAGSADGLEFTLSDEKNPAKRHLLFWKKDGKLYAKDLNSRRQEAFVVDTVVQDGLPWDQGFYKPQNAKAK